MKVAQIKEKEPPKFLNSGSYGCTFRPGISCTAEGTLVDKYLTKIQRLKDASTREQEIGKKIKKIRNYEDYYAPILSNCKVFLSTVSETEIEKCKILSTETDGSVKYEANKIRYVGKNTLLKHLLAIYKSKPNSIMREIVNSHMALLEGFNRLSAAGIIHFDVKENNVMCEDKTGAPIIIDFGLSIDETELAKKEYNDAFYVYGPDYGPWCLEIAILGFAANEIGETEEKTESIAGYIGFGEAVQPKKWTDQAMKQEQLDKIIVDYVKQNYGLNELFSQAQREEYRIKAQKYYNKYVGKPWAEVVIEILNSKNTWDNYGLAVVYLYIIRSLKLEEVSKIKEYKQYLEEVMMSTPIERPTCEKTMLKIKEIFGKIPKRETRNMRTQIVAKALKKENVEEVTKNVWETIKEEIKNEERIYKQSKQ